MKLAILALIAFVAACQPATVYVPIVVTATPEPAPYSRSLTNPTAAPPSASRCIDFLEADRHIGETTCVTGIVYSTYKDPKSSAFFIDFSRSRTTFTAVSFKYTFDGIVNRCVEIYGKIQTYQDHAEIIIEQQSQLRFCGSAGAMSFWDLVRATPTFDLCAYVECTPPTKSLKPTDSYCPYGMTWACPTTEPEPRHDQK